MSPIVCLYIPTWVGGGGGGRASSTTTYMEMFIALKRGLQRVIVVVFLDR